MKHLYIIFLLLIFASCGVTVEGTVENDCQPQLWPDYNGVTVPKNIAPLNFSTVAFDSLQRIEAVLKTPDGKNYDFSGKNFTKFSQAFYRGLYPAAKRIANC